MTCRLRRCYCWLRDATFTLQALLGTGYVDEAKAWRDWLLRAAAGDPADLRIMYGLDGTRRIPEYTLHLARESGLAPSEDAWDLQKARLDFLEDHWDDPDNSLWEVRGDRRPFVHSKVMAWAGVDRALRAVEHFGLPGPVDRWREQQARALFERLLALRNDLGLLSEEYDTRAGRQLGNTPQAFSHVGLVNTALQLSLSSTLAPSCAR